MSGVAPKVLFIYNEHLATEALLGEAFTECGFDVDTFEVVPAERIDDPAVDVTFPDPTGYDVIVPLGRALARVRRRAAPHLGGRRDETGARRRRRGGRAARRVLRRSTPRPGVRRVGGRDQPSRRSVGTTSTATIPTWCPAGRGSNGISTGGRCRPARPRSPGPRTRRRRSCSAARWRCSFTRRSTLHCSSCGWPRIATARSSAPGSATTNYASAQPNSRRTPRQESEVWCAAS